MDNIEFKALEEEFIALQKEVSELKQSSEYKNGKCEALNIQIQKLEEALDRLNNKKESIIDNSLSKRENISRKIDLFGFLGVGSGIIVAIILFGIITEEIGIMLEYFSVACISVSTIMVLKMVIEMVIDNYIMEKLSKTDEYINIEGLRKKVEKTLEEIKNRKDILIQAKDIEVEQYNDKIQRLYEVELALSANISDSQIDAMQTLFEDAANKQKGSKPKKRQRKKENKTTGDI